MINFCFQRFFNLTIKGGPRLGCSVGPVPKREGSLPSLPNCPDERITKNLVCLLLRCNFRILESTKNQDGSFNVITHLDVGFKK